MKMEIKRFVDEDFEEEHNTVFNAGRVYQEEHHFYIGYQQLGAERTFSIGQPVYDVTGNLMGYLGIDLCDNLDYSGSTKNCRFPVERWQICLPTEHCVEGKTVYTYWQNRERLEMEKRNDRTEQERSTVS